MSLNGNAPKSTKTYDKSMLLPLILLIGAGGLLVVSQMPETAPRQVSSAVNSKKYEDTVNKHLMLTSERIQLQKKRMQVENNALAPDVHTTIARPAYEPANDFVDVAPDQHAYEVAKELGRGERSAVAPQSPHEIIQAEVFNQQLEQASDREYKERYAQQFVANAARNGWTVKLSPDYKVLSVKPIRNPTSQGQLFNSGGESAQ